VGCARIEDAGAPLGSSWQKIDEGVKNLCGWRAFWFVWDSMFLGGAMLCGIEMGNGLVGKW